MYGFETVHLSQKRLKPSTGGPLSLFGLGTNENHFVPK